MRYLFFLLFLPSLLFSQTTKEYTKDIEGFGYANDGYYNYEAKIKYQLWNQGLGDIVLKIGIIDYKITRFRDKNMNEIYSLSSPVADQFPIILKNHQADVRFNLIIEWKGGVGSKFVSFPNLKEEAVRQGSLDLYYFTEDQVMEMVDTFELNNNKDNIEDLDVKMSIVYIDNGYFGELASISDEYYKSKTTSSKNSSSNNNSSKSISNTKKEKTSKSNNTITREEYLAIKKRQGSRETTRKIKDLENQGYDSQTATKIVTTDNTNRAIQGAANQLIDGIFGEWDEEAYFANQQKKIDKYRARKKRQQLQENYKKEAHTEKKMESKNASGLLLKRSKKGWFGYVDENDKWVIKAKYLKAKPFKNGEAEVITKTNNTIIINTNGKKIKDI